MRYKENAGEMMKSSSKRQRLFSTHSYLHRWLLGLGFVLAFLVMGFGHPTTAFADIGSQIVSQSPVTIPKGQVVQDVVTIGHDAAISGEVTEAVIVLNGDIHLTSTARTGIVIDLGGKVTQTPGSHVQAVYALSFDKPLWNSITVGALLTLAVWGARVIVSAGFILCAMVLAFLLKRWLTRPVANLETSVRRHGVTGVFVSLGLVVLMGLLAITIIGLPIVAILLVLDVMAGLVGFTGVSVWLGQRTNVGGLRSRPAWVQALMGATIIIAFANLPIVGPLLLIVTWVVSVGVTTTWVGQIWQERKHKRIDSHQRR